MTKTRGDTTKAKKKDKHGTRKNELLTKRIGTFPFFVPPSALLFYSDWHDAVLGGPDGDDGGDGPPDNGSRITPAQAVRVEYLQQERGNRDSAPNFGSDK